MDLDLRKLRYFAAVAEHHHFGRAAAALYIAQPVLSRQIRALEHDLGCSLLVRTTRRVELTPAGEQLAEQARGIFAAVDTGLRRVQETARGVERLVIAFAPGLRVSDAVRAYAPSHPGVQVELLRLHWWEQDAPLRDGRSDIGYVRRPFDEDGLRVVPIGRERRVACLPTGHRLARRRSLTQADLADESILDAQSRRTSSVEEKFELVAAGHGIAVVPRSVADAYSRGDLVAVPVTDSVPVETCLISAADRRQRRILDFVRVAAEVLTDKPNRLAAVD